MKKKIQLKKKVIAMVTHCHPGWTSTTASWPHLPLLPALHFYPAFAAPSVCSNPGLCMAHPPLLQSFIRGSLSLTPFLME